MKKIITIIVYIVLAIVLFGSTIFFFGNNPAKIEELFNTTIKSLENPDELESLFTEQALNESEEGNINQGIEEIKEFYQGKFVKAEDLVVFHETGNIFRAYATVITDKGEYFVCIGATGARRIDPVGIKQLIIEDNHNFKKKDIFKKKELKKYEGKADACGITIRRPNDNR